jgi:tetratricopeptide (TPR) repeat protein
MICFACSSVHRRFISVALAGILISITHAWAEDSETAYNRAQATIQAENWQEAIKQLEALYREAPEHAGALLDLAVLYCRIGNETKVDETLNRLESHFSLPPAIQAVVDTLRLRSCSRSDVGTRWRFETALGYDKNINQGSALRSFTLGGGSIPELDVTLDEDFLPRTSPFASFQAEIIHNRSAYRRFYAVFQTRNYSATSDYDEMAALVGYEKALFNPDWGISSTLNVALRSLGGQLYQQALLAELKAAPVSVQFGNVGLGFNLRTVLANYPSRAVLDNWETSFTVPAIWQLSDQVALRFSLGWLYDAARNARPGGSRAGPTASIEWLQRLGYDSQLYMALDSRRLSGSFPYSPPLLEMTQRQRRHALTFAWEKNLSRSSSLRLEYQYTRNTDTIPMYHFNNGAVMVQWIKSGQF